MRENERIRSKYALLQEELEECQQLLSLEQARGAEDRANAIEDIKRLEV